MKILNLYAGIGGNRKLWPKEHKVTAVEINPKIAQTYQDFFPDDTVIISDAHSFLLEHFKDFDFIWASPPCPSHSKFRFMTTKMTDSGRSRPIIYPDMTLYQEIILLTHYSKTKWVIENVASYYNPLIKPKEVSRHYFWANFIISDVPVSSSLDIKKSLIKNSHFDLTDKDTGHRKDQILHNLVEPELGLHVFNCAFRSVQKTLKEEATKCL